MTTQEIYELEDKELFPTTVYFTVYDGEEKKKFAIKGLMYISVFGFQNIYFNPDMSIDISLRLDKNEIDFDFGGTWVTVALRRVK